MISLMLPKRTVLAVWMRYLFCHFLSPVTTKWSSHHSVSAFRSCIVIITLAPSILSFGGMKQKVFTARRPLIYF